MLVPLLAMKRPPGGVPEWPVFVPHLVFSFHTQEEVLKKKRQQVMEEERRLEHERNVCAIRVPFAS